MIVVVKNQGKKDFENSNAVQKFNCRSRWFGFTVLPQYLKYLVRLIFKHCVLRYSAAEEGKFEALLILGFLSFRKFSSISLFFFRRSRQEAFVSKNLLKMIMYELLYGSSPVEDEKRTFNLRYRNGRSRATLAKNLDFYG